MTYSPASLAQFREEFPKFISTADAVVERALSTGLLWVGQNWVNEADYQRGQMLRAAHELTLDGHGGGAEAAIAENGLTGFSQVSSGKLSFTRGGTGSDQGGDKGSTLPLSIYGKRYLEIARRNVAGPRVASGE